MEEGTIVHVDYDLYNADSGDLIETTREEVAKEHDMHQEVEPTPLVCVVGAGNLISGFEDSLLEAEADKDISLRLHLRTLTEKRTQTKLRPSQLTNYYATYVTLSPYTSEVQ